MQSRDFLKKAFFDFYKSEAKSIVPPSKIQEREFGFLLFAEGRMYRHKKFADRNELQSFLQEIPVSDAYYSCAYYQDPEADMEKKGWLGADLIFDIDADHIPTSCDRLHDEWSCCSCGFPGKGIVPEQCPSCGGQKLDSKTWLCEKCLDSAKNETIKLVDMLRRDFGFSEKEIHVFFSGHRGYHVHVESEAVKALDSIARKEIVDYVCGIGLETGFDETEGKFKAHLPPAPRLDELGWRGRLAKGVYDFVLKAEAEDYTSLGLKKAIAEKMVQNKDLILKKWDSIGPYRAVKGLGLEVWKKIVNSCKEAVAAKVDTVVTTDTHRLIRMAGTLHGKTGLKKVEVPMSELEGFDPLKEAVAFKNGVVTVLVSSAPQFRLGEETFGPYENHKVQLPTAAAVLLVGKGRAEVAE
ncbi:MAG: DNA primase small subunit PriS [Candidatus Bathyarchaeia archaeon]